MGKGIIEKVSELLPSKRSDLVLALAKMYRDNKDKQNACETLKQYFDLVPQNTDLESIQLRKSVCN